MLVNHSCFPRPRMTAPRARAIARLTIEGMTSVHAARAIFTALAGVEGVALADVGRGIATVEHDGTVTDDALRQAVEIAGFGVSAIRSSRGVLPLA